MRSLLAGAAVVLMACPGPTPTPDAGFDAGAQISIVDLCERLSTARCALKDRCYPAFLRLTLDDCRTIENSTCLAEYEAMRGSFDDAVVEIAPERLASCVERMQSSACPPSFPPDYPVAVARPFSDCGLQTGLLVGKVPAGETCARAVECAAGTVCVKPGGVCRGTCSTSPVEGEPCAFGCATGLICGTDGGCQQTQPLTATCTSSAQCQADLICEAGTCRARRRLNETCRFDPDRLSQCEPGLACDVVPFVSGLTGTCVRPQAEFGACRFHWSCLPGLVCADIDFTPFPAAAPSGGFCRAPDAEDANCVPTAYARYIGEQCGSGLSCQVIDRKCRALPTLGDGCRPSVQDCSGFTVYCKPTGSGDVGTCTGPAGLGDRCAFTIDAQRTVRIPCSSGYCDGTTELCRPASKPINALCGEDGECLSNRCAVQQDRSLRCAQAC